MGGLGSAATPPTLGSEEATLLLRPGRAQAETDGQPVSTPPHRGLRAGRHPPTPAEGFQQQAAPRWVPEQRPGLWPSPPQRGTPPHPAAPHLLGQPGGPNCSPLTPPEYTATSPLTVATPPNTQPHLLHRHTTSPHSNTFLISAAPCTQPQHTTTTRLPPHTHSHSSSTENPDFYDPQYIPKHPNTHTASTTSSNASTPHSNPNISPGTPRTLLQL